MIFSPQIPVTNIYYLYCYAWERFEEGKILALGAEASPDLPNLLTHVLLNGMHAMFRRGLDRTYHPIIEELTTVRGHIELGASLRLQARNVRRLQCSYDELSHDVLHNQILKATLKRLFTLPGLEPHLANDAKRMLHRLYDISDIRLTQRCFARVQLHRNNAYYDLLLHISELLFGYLIPTPDGTGHRFKNVLSDEPEMARVFEAFVRNFYRLEQSHYRVEPLTIAWDATPVLVNTGDRLPQMRVDVFLRAPNRQVIIDTKYYAEALQTYHGATSFRSPHLFQLFSYLKNQAPRVPFGSRLDGMLLYPQVGFQLDATYDVQEHKIKIATIDLSMPWQQIATSLLNLI